MSDIKVDPQIHPGKAEVNGTRLYYEDAAKGPSLLFIPGGSVDAWHYAAVAEILARDFRVVTYDRRGNGRSPRPPTWHRHRHRRTSRRCRGSHRFVGTGAVRGVGGQSGRGDPVGTSGSPARPGARRDGAGTALVQCAHRRCRTGSWLGGLGRIRRSPPAGDGRVPRARPPVGRQRVRRTRRGGQVADGRQCRSISRLRDPGSRRLPARTGRCSGCDTSGRPAVHGHGGPKESGHATLSCRGHTG